MRDWEQRAAAGWQIYQQLIAPGPDEAWQQLDNNNQRLAVRECRPAPASSSTREDDDMGFVVNVSAGGDGEEYGSATPGTHNAVCVGLIDIGTHDGKFGPKRKTILMWEIDEQRQDGKRFRVHAWYTQSLHPKATLRHTLEAWRGKALPNGQQFDMRQLIGAPAMITLMEGSDPAYVDVAGVAPLPKGMQKLKPEGETWLLDLDAPDWDVHEALPDWLKTQVAKSPEYAATQMASKSRFNEWTPDVTEDAKVAEPAGDFDDDVPF